MIIRKRAGRHTRNTHERKPAPRNKRVWERRPREWLKYQIKNLEIYLRIERERPLGRPIKSLQQGNKRRSVTGRDRGKRRKKKKKKFVRKFRNRKKKELDSKFEKTKEKGLDMLGKKGIM